MDKAAARKAEREKRQARIKASSSNRLSKITGVAGSQDFKKPVVYEKPSTESLVRGLAESSYTNESQDKQQPPDPLMEILRTIDHPNNPLFSKNLNDLPQNKDPSLHDFLAQNEPYNTNRQHTAAQQAQQLQQRSRQQVLIHFSWDLIHLIISLALGLYGALVNPWLVPKFFIAIQILLWSCRATLKQQKPGLPQILIPFMSMLPSNRQRQLNIVGSAVTAVRTAYQNMAFVLFIYGLVSLGGSDFVRPI